MSSTLIAVSFEVQDPALVGEFWSKLLDRPGDVLLPGHGNQVGLRFVPAVSAPSRQRLHLHVTSSTAHDQVGLIDTALSLGGHRRGSGPLPIGRDIYLTDPEGYDFCIIEPGNDYLDGCGPLGEITCDGTRDVGQFWHEALDWPLVWDEGEQTAIQSPSGGTKIAWDSGPDEPESGWSRQRFELGAVDIAAETARLVSLGATVVREEADTVVLADPDGVQFTVGQV